MKVVIVGGVAGGASAAARARRLSEDAEIILIERGPDVSFANCGMPYYVGETISDRSKLLVTSPELLRNRYNMDVRVLSSVESIDRSKQEITVRRIDSGTEYTESYDKLILAPGAAPLKPPIPGIDLPGIHTLRNLQDMDQIKAATDSGATRAVVIGAGFIGLELVENLVARGISTTVVELQDQVMPPLDKEMTAPLVDILEANGVTLLLGQSADRFEASGDEITVHLSSGITLSTQVVLLGIGVRPENTLAVEAGLQIGERGGIKVDQHMQTSDSNIYAVGDAIEVEDFVLKTPTQIPLAGPANRQGRIAANNIFGKPDTYRGTQGTAVLGLFGLTAAATGSPEKALRRNQIPYFSAHIHPKNHAGYYPGAEQMSLKLLYHSDSGAILGAQAVGGSGVDKRIDVVATAIQSNMTVYDLEELELCYAPQFGSAKDPVNMAGFVAAGRLRGEHPQISVADMPSMKASDLPLLLDVRTAKEFEAGHIPDAINIPIDDIRNRLDEIPLEQEIIAYCQVGFRGYLATRILLQEGFSVVNLSGGYKTYANYYARQP